MDTRHSSQCGFSLVELLISMAVGMMILGALIGSFLVQNKSLAAQEQVTQMVQTARAAMDMICRDLQMAGYNPTGGVFAGITYAPGQLQIQADLNGDGDTGDADETIVYAYDGTNLRINRNATAFAEAVQSFTFEYLDGSGSTTTTTADIRQVRITLTARTEKPDSNFGTNNGYRTYSLRSVVTPKNIGI